MRYLGIKSHGTFNLALNGLEEIGVWGEGECQMIIKQMQQNIKNN